MWGADVIRSSLDLNAPRAQYTARGSYYKHEPNDLTEGAHPFMYAYLNPYSKAYRTLFGGVQAATGETAIRTRDRLDLERTDDGMIVGIVISSDGRAFRIVSADRDYSKAPKQAFRIVGLPVGYETVMRLVEIPNPWGLR